MPAGAFDWGFGTLLTYLVCSVPVSVLESWRTSLLFFMSFSFSLFCYSKFQLLIQIGVYLTDPFLFLLENCVFISLCFVRISRVKSSVLTA